MTYSSALMQHAESELRAAGLLDHDSDYYGAIGRAVLDLVEVFSSQGHSGASADMTIEILQALLRFRPLTPLTDNPDEWMEVTDGLWQSYRRSDAFSEDGGKTYYLVDNKNEVFKSKEYQNEQ